MNFLEALASGKKFRRPKMERETICWHGPPPANPVDREHFVFAFPVPDLLALDWEIEPVRVTISREDFDAAVARADKFSGTFKGGAFRDWVAEELGLGGKSK